MLFSFLMLVYIFEWAVHCIVHCELYYSSANEQTTPLDAKVKFLEFDIIHVAAFAAVFPPSIFLAKMFRSFKVLDGSFYGASGQLQFFSDGTNRRIAFTFPVRPIMQIHINHNSPVWKLRSIK